MFDSTYPAVPVGPPPSSRIVIPASISIHSGVEHFEVKGAGAILIPLTTGDKITLLNVEGGQSTELLAVDSEGRINTGMIGLPSNSMAEGLKALLSGEAATGSGLGGLRLGLERRGINLAKARSVTLFGEHTLAGSEETFVAQRDGLLVVAAPGAPMAPDQQDTATPIRVTVQRATIRTIVHFPLPDPLAEPILDLRVNSGTAESYFVKAGDFIQIIDVDGRQCTDFQCFAARKLDRGIEHPLDVTTSRTLMGHAYSMPGLHAKYFDQDMVPLVEVVQDTVGRHDAFAMACTAKYYDDIGYPGHTNCSENFNKTLAKHGIASRRGWMAVNLFFNTGIDAHGVLYSDEPWSRPGDYVLKNFKSA